MYIIPNAVNYNIYYVILKHSRIYHERYSI